MHHLFSMELNMLNFAFAFTSSTYTRVVDFGHYFSPKSTLRLIRESTCTRVYTVLREDLRRMFRWSQDWKLLFNLKSAQLCTWERETKSYHMKWEVRY